MTTPNINTSYLDARLSNMMVTWFDEKPSLLRSVSGVVPVQKPTGRYIVWDRAALTRNNAKRRAPGTKPAEANFDFSDRDYTTAEWALRVPLYDELERASDVELRRPISDFVAANIMRAESIDFINRFMVTGVWTNEDTLVGNAQWDDYTNSNPLTAIETAIETIASFGFPPNVMVLNSAVARTILNHPVIRALDNRNVIQVTGRSARASRLAEIFDLEEVVIADDYYNTSAMGLNETRTAMLGDSVLLAYRNKSPSMSVPSAMHTFTWAGVDGGGAVEVYRDGDEGKKTTWFDGRSWSGGEVVAPDLGFLFLDVLGS